MGGGGWDSISEGYYYYLIGLVEDGISDGIGWGEGGGGSLGARGMGLGEGRARGGGGIGRRARVGNVFDGIVLVLDNISNSGVILVFSRWVRFPSWHSGPAIIPIIQSHSI